MVYLIGGAPRLGKSLIAEELMKKTGTPWMSADPLRDALAAMLSPEKIRTQFPLNELKDDKWLSLPTDELVNIQLKEIESMENSLEGLIKHLVFDNYKFILEGVHFLPSQISNLIKREKDLSKRLKCIWITPPNNLSDIIEGFKKNTNESNWLKSSDAGVLKAVANLVMDFGNKIRREAEENNLPYFDRTDNFEKDVKNVVEKLTK